MSQITKHFLAPSNKLYFHEKTNDFFLPGSDSHEVLQKVSILKVNYLLLLLTIKNSSFQIFIFVL